MRAKEGLGVRKKLGMLLSTLKNGGSGQKRNNTWTSSTGLPVMDLSETSIPNIMGIHYITHGEKELFPTDSLSQNSGSSFHPRYFMIDDLRANEQGSNVHRITSQCLITKLVTGQATKGLDEKTQKRRQANWLPWYNEEDSNGKFTEFEQMDLPLIANKFRDVWDVVMPENQSRILPRMLAAIGKEMRAILQSCNQISKKTRGGRIPLGELSNNKRKQPEVETTISTKKRCVTPTLIVTTLVASGLPLQLTLNFLRGAICDE
jgi:hypothetical protein